MMFSFPFKNWHDFHQMSCGKNVLLISFQAKWDPFCPDSFHSSVSLYFLILFVLQTFPHSIFSHAPAQPFRLPKGLWIRSIWFELLKSFLSFQITNPCHFWGLPILATSYNTSSSNINYNICRALLKCLWKCIFQEICDVNISFSQPWIPDGPLALVKTPCRIREYLAIILKNHM